MKVCCAQHGLFPERSECFMNAFLECMGSVFGTHFWNTWNAFGTHLLHILIPEFYEAESRCSGIEHFLRLREGE